MGEREREGEEERRNVFDKGSTTLDAVSPAFKFRLSVAWLSVRWGKVLATEENVILGCVTNGNVTLKARLQRGQ